MNLTKWQFISTIWATWILSSVIIEIGMLKNLKIPYNNYKIEYHKNIPPILIIMDGIMTIIFVLYWFLYIFPKIIFELRKE
jgi:hypothetical protein